MGTVRRRKGRANGKASPANGRVNGKDAGTSQDDWETPLKKEPRTSHPVIAANICALTGFLLYANAIWKCGFCYDDAAAIEKNRDVLNIKGDGVMSPWRDIWSHDFWGIDIRSAPSNKSYRPLVITSFRIDSWISREPWIFHFTNALVFAASCWLVVLMLARATVGNTTSKSARDTVAAVMLSGLWFASHPVHTEAVASLVGRAEVIAAIFCVVGCGLAYSEGQKERVMLRWAAAAVFLFAACLCKETAVVLPVIVAAADIAFLLFAPKHASKTVPNTRLLGRAAILASVSFAYLCFRVWLFGDSETGQTLAQSTVEVNFVGHLAGMDKLRTAISIQAKYVRLLVWPGVLSCDYSLGVIEPVTSWATPEMAFSAFVASVIIGWLLCGLFQLRKIGDTTLLLALGWTFGPLIPASHVVGIGTVMAERLLFLPSIGVTMLICHFVSWLTQRLPGGGQISQVVLAICIAVFARQTVTRNLDWADSGTLFAADIESHPEATKLLLGRARHPQVDNDTAFRYALTAQRVLDRHATSLTRSPYPYAKRLMAQLKTETEKWPQGANKSEAVQYAREVIAMGNRFGPVGWSWIHEKKARALLDLAGSTFDPVMMNEAADALVVAIDYRDKASSGGLFCTLGVTLVALNRNEEAHERYKECFLIKRGAAGFNDRRNHAIALRKLAGVDSNDVAAAGYWGQRAIEAIQHLLDRPNEISNELAYWVNNKNTIKKMMGEAAEADTTDKEAAKDAILALMKEAAEAEANAKAADNVEGS